MSLYFTVGWHMRSGPLLHLIFLAPSIHVRFLIHFPYFSVCPLLISIVIDFFIPGWLFQPSSHPCRLLRRLVFVSTLICMPPIWMFNNFNQCVLMVSVAAFIITVMTSLDCRLSAVGSSAGYIAMAVALSFGIRRWLISTCSLFAVQKRKYTLVT